MKMSLATGFRLYDNTIGLSDYLQPIALLAARLYVAWVFFSAGLTKLNDWESTLFLFEYEYQVPFLSHTVAAYMGTAGELVLPVLLAIGLASRISAIGLSIVNIVAVISLEEIAAAALYGHVIWGLLLVLTVVWGAGQIAADFWVRPYLEERGLGKKNLID